MRIVSNTLTKNLLYCVSNRLLNRPNLVGIDFECSRRTLLQFPALICWNGTRNAEHYRHPLDSIARPFTLLKRSGTTHRVRPIYITVDQFVLNFPIGHTLVKLATLSKELTRFHRRVSGRRGPKYCCLSATIWTN